MAPRRLASWLTVAFVGVVIIAALVVALLPDEHVERAATASADEQSEQVVTTTAERQPVPPPFLLDLATGEMTQLAESLADAVHAYVPSPDGARLVYAPRHESFERIVNIDGSGVRPLESPKGLYATATRWSPDGTKLVYQERDVEENDLLPEAELGNLVVEDLESGRRTQVTDFKQGSGAAFHFLWPRFSADGQNVIFHFPRNQSQRLKFDAWSVPITGGKPKLVLRDASWPVPFPGGKRIAYVPGASGFNGHSIAIADFHGSRPRTLVKADEPIGWPSISPDGSKIAYTTNDDTIHVVKVATGVHTAVAKGSAAEWLDDVTLIINPS